MKISTKFNKEYDCQDITVSDFSVELGNNFTYDMFMREVFKNKELTSLLWDIASLEDSVIFICNGMYCDIKQEACVNDILDHFRVYEREEEHLHGHIKEPEWSI